MKRLYFILFSLTVLLLLCAACAATHNVENAGTISSDMPNSSESDLNLPISSQTPSGFSASDSGSAIINEIEIIEACAAYFEASSMGSLIAEPFLSIQEYVNNPDNTIGMKIAIYHKLLQFDNIEFKSTLYGEEMIRCYPVEICNNLTNQMFGITLDWTDRHLEIPEGTFVMPYGYGGTMLDAEISKEDSNMEGNQIFLSAVQYWNEYGEEANPIKQLSYEFEHIPQNDLCQFKLVSLSASNLK